MLRRFIRRGENMLMRAGDGISQSARRAAIPLYDLYISRESLYGDDMRHEALLNGPFDISQN